MLRGRLGYQDLVQLDQTGACFLQFHCILGPGSSTSQVNQGIKTRIPKVVPLKVPLNVLLIWPLYYLKDLQKGFAKPNATTFVKCPRVQT